MFLRINRNLTSFDRLRVLAAQELLAPLLARALFLGCTVLQSSTNELSRAYLLTFLASVLSDTVSVKRRLQTADQG